MTESHDTEQTRAEMAAERTRMAEDRTRLAAERTYSGWVGMAMGALGVALGLRALFGPFEPTWVPKLAASVFVAAALFILWAAWRNATGASGHLGNNRAEGQPPSRVGWITAALAAGTLLVGVLLWWL